MTTEVGFLMAVGCEMKVGVRERGMIVICESLRMVAE